MRLLHEGSVPLVTSDKLTLHQTCMMFPQHLSKYHVIYIYMQYIYKQMLSNVIFAYTQSIFIHMYICLIMFVHISSVHRLRSLLSDSFSGQHGLVRSYCVLMMPLRPHHGMVALLAFLQRARRFNCTEKSQCLKAI